MTAQNVPHIVAFESSASWRERSAITGTSGLTVWLTGLSGSGKSTIAHEVETRLLADRKLAYVLDGDNLRRGINSDLGFSAEDRAENVRRVGEIARLMNDAGLIVLVPVISPFANGRLSVREAHDVAGLPFAEVYVDTSLAACEARDTKGLYAKARAGEIPDFTGIGSPYEPPANPDLRIDTSAVSLEDATSAVLSLCESVTRT